MNKKTAVKVLVLLLGAVSVGILMVRFSDNWHKLEKSFFSINPFLGTLGFVFCLLSYILDTVCFWKVYNISNNSRKMTFSHAFVAVNLPGLLRYLPGKAWSYLAQMYWADRMGFHQVRVLSTSAHLISATAILSGLAGAVLCVLRDIHFHDSKAAVFCVLLIIASGLGIWIYLIGRKFVELLVRIRLSKNFILDDISLRQFLWVLFLCAFNWFILGVGGVFSFLACGGAFSIISSIAIICAMTIGWLAGFLVFISPGGVGIREGAIFWILKPWLGTENALLVPVLTRVLGLACELFIALIATSVLIYSNKSEKNQLPELSKPS